MAKAIRSAAVERTEAAPLVSSRRGKFVTLEHLELEAEAGDKLTKYKDYVREIEGEEPKEGSICSAALEMLFAADTGFIESLETNRKAEKNGAGKQHEAGKQEKAVASGAVGASSNHSGAEVDKRKMSDEQTAAAVAAG